MPQSVSIQKTNDGWEIKNLQAQRSIDEHNKGNQLSFTGMTIHQSPCAPHNLLQDTYQNTKDDIEAVVKFDKQHVVEVYNSGKDQRNSPC